MKLLYKPFGIVFGIIGGILAKKLFEQVWGLIDKEEPPDPKHRETTWIKLIGALALEGAIFRAIRGLFDHGSRMGFARLTGSWPGEERPEPE